MGDLASKLVAEAKLLKKEEGLREKKVRVSPRNFTFTGEMAECSLPLSKHLADRFASQLREYGVQVVSGSGDESRAITLRGEWNVESKSEYLRLSLKVTQLVGQNELNRLASKEGRVPVADIDEKDRGPDLDYHGCNVVKQLEGGTRGNRPHTVYVRPLSVSRTVTAQPEGLGRYLADWLTRALGQSSRFKPVAVVATLDRVPVKEQLSKSRFPLGPGPFPEQARMGP